MASYIAVFLLEFTSLILLWFILRKVFKKTRIYKIALICLLISLIVGFVSSYRTTGYNVTMEYLTEINNQTIETTGKSISQEEENAYKEELFQQDEFKTILITNSIKMSLFPFLGVLLFTIFLGNRTRSKFTSNSG